MFDYVRASVSSAKRARASAATARLPALARLLPHHPARSSASGSFPEHHYLCSKGAAPNAVKPRDVTFAQALTTASSLFGDGWRDFADGHPDRKTSGALQRRTRPCRSSAGG